MEGYTYAVHVLFHKYFPSALSYISVRVHITILSLCRPVVAVAAAIGMPCNIRLKLDERPYRNELCVSSTRARRRRSTSALYKLLL